MGKLKSTCRKCGETFTVNRSNMKKPTDDPRVLHLREELGDDSIIRLGDHFETTRVGAPAPKPKRKSNSGKQITKKGDKVVVEAPPAPSA